VLAIYFHESTKQILETSLLESPVCHQCGWWHHSSYDFTQQPFWKYIIRRGGRKEDTTNHLIPVRLLQHHKPGFWVSTFEDSDPFPALVAGRTASLMHLYWISNQFTAQGWLCSRIKLKRNGCFRLAATSMERVHNFIKRPLMRSCLLVITKKIQLLYDGSNSPVLWFVG